MVRLDTLVRQVLADARERLEKDAGADGAAPAPTRQREIVARGKGLGCDRGCGAHVASPRAPSNQQRGARRPSGGLGK